MARILIVTPARRGSTKGNRITAERWSGLLQSLGHSAPVTDRIVSGDFDCLITLHATQSVDVITEFQKQCPGKPTVLCLTGTDLHRDLNGLCGPTAARQASASIQLSCQLVVLEPEGARSLPGEAQARVTVIRQSAIPVARKPDPLEDCFEVCVIGHLRDEKDPFLASRAARSLPDDSKIEISHIGAALESRFEQLARGEMNSNPRYHWIGSLPHSETQHRLARSRLMILTSRIEGAPNVISEAIVNRVPVLATRIPATVGLLGAEYPGLFAPGDFNTLCGLLVRVERDHAFLAGLQSAVEQLAPRFLPEMEQKELQQMLRRLEVL